MNKKAMFFTVLVIALLSLFLVSYSIYSMTDERKAINKRIKTMNNFVFSLEKDIPRKLYISGFRIIFLFEKRMISTGNYIDDVDLRFEEAFFNRTINGTASLEEDGLFEGITFENIQDNINDKAGIVNVDVSLLNPNISITQEDPWNVKVTLSMDLLIKDNGDLAFWNKTSYVSSVYIPIERFEDPLYIINTNGIITNRINRTIYTQFVNGIDVSNLLSHTENSYYINSTTAPSFLNRFEGNLSADENGIESLVYLPELSAQGISIKDKSVVDYIYFSDDNPSFYNIQGMPSWFRLDVNHTSVYEANGLII